MTFGEKLRRARLELNLSQGELAEKVGVTIRSISRYEQMEMRPRKDILRKLSESLRVSMSYLLDEEEEDKQKNIERELFLANVHNEYGARGAREASEVLDRASALFAGGRLSDEAREIFFESLMEVYLKSKADAREKFTPNSRKKKKLQVPRHEMGSNSR